MTYEEAIYYAKGMKEADSSEPFSTFIDMAIESLEKVKESEEPSGVTAEAAEIALLTQLANMSGTMSKLAHEKLDKIRFIVNFEVGNRHEIGDKILAVIDGSDNE